MPRRQSVATIRPAQGGGLFTNASAENVGPSNYVRKTNWRRLDDREIAREGTVLFRPNTGLPQGVQALNAGSDVVGMWEAVRPNGQRAVVVATRTTIYKFDYTTGTWSTIGSGYSASGDRWQTESLDGYLIFNNGVDLLFTYRVEESSTVPIHELRAIGVAAVGTIAVFNGFLLCGDITEIQTAELPGIMNGGTPYGLVDPSKTNRIRYKIIWADYNAPRNWAPIIAGTIQSLTKNVVTLAYASNSFAIGDKVAVIGAGAGGGTLGGDESNPDGILITNVVGNVLTLAVQADNALTFPLSVTVTRFKDVSTFAGSATLTDDSSGIRAIRQLNRGLFVVYRETGIFHGRYTGQVETPFMFTPIYGGRNVPFYPHAIQELSGDRHVYPTETAFYVYDGAGEPTLFQPLHDAKDLFFIGAQPGDVFAAHNPLTMELWFFTTNGVLTYDYVKGTAAWIDEAYSAFAYVRKPDGTNSTGPSDYWFLLSRAGRVLRYGLSQTGVGSYFRVSDSTGLPVPYTASIRSGLFGGGNENDEKDLLAFTPLLSSLSNDVDLRVTLFGCDNPSRDPQVLCEVTLDEPLVAPTIPCFFRNIYFQDQIDVLVSGVAFELTARQYKLNRVASDGVTRSNL